MRQFFLVLMIAVFALPALAQDDAETLTLTEDQINQSYRISEMPRVRFENEQIDLVPGQMVLNADFIPQRRGGDPVAISVTFVPSVTDGFVTWTVVDASADGEMVSDELLEALNTVIVNSWRRFVHEQVSRHLVESIVITDTDITWTYAAGTWVPPVVDPATVILTEQQINDTYAEYVADRDALDSLTVDMQPGQVLIAAAYTPERTGEPFTVTAPYVPTIENDRVVWTVISTTIAGQPATQEAIDRVNELIETTWQRYIRLQSSGRVTAVEISDTEMVITLGARLGA